MFLKRKWDGDPSWMEVYIKIILKSQFYHQNKCANKIGTHFVY